jgi:hypothetical protein
MNDLSITNSAPFVIDQLIENGDFSVTGGDLSAESATGTFGSCNIIDFVNGTYHVVGGTGIGSDFSNATMSSTFDWMKIENRNFFVNDSNHGAQNIQ